MKKSGLLLLLLLSTVRLEAATRTWAGPTGVWSNPASWVEGIAPVAGDSLVFPRPTVFGARATNDLAPGTPFQSLLIDMGGPIVAGNEIVLGSGGLTHTDSMMGGNLDVEIPIRLGAPQTWNIESFAVLFGRIDLNGQALSITGRSVWIRGPIVGTGSINVSLSFSMRLTGANTTTAPLTFTNTEMIFESDYPGDVTGSGGSVTVRHFTTPGALAVTLGTLSLTGTDYTTDTEQVDVYTTGLALNGGTFAVHIASDGTTQTTPISRTFVAGSVSLGNAELLLDTWISAGRPDIAPGTTFTMIHNDGTDPVVGTFAGLPEGATITSVPSTSGPPGPPDSGREQTFTISYQGGTGNDVVLTAQPRATGTTLIVTNLNDSGPGSLRQAVSDSNSLGGANTIQFLGGLSGTITLTSGEMSITDSVTIRGPGSSLITVSGNNTSRIFNALARQVSIVGLTLTAGSAPSGGALDVQADALSLYDVNVTNSIALAGNGGGVRYRPHPDPEFLAIQTVFVASSVISGNDAPAGAGGGLAINAARFQMHQVTVDGNTAGFDGGGMDLRIFAPPSSGLELTLCTITGNQAGTAGVGHGGGMSVFTENGVELYVQPRIVAVRLNGNSATGDGGGIYTRGGLPNSPWTIRHSEIVGNNALRGGGIFNGDNQPPGGFGSGAVRIHESTVANNIAVTEGGGVFMPYTSTLSGATITGNSAGVAGGNLRYADPGTGRHTITNSIVADGVAPLNPDIHTSGTGTVGVTYSLIETPGTAALTPGSGVITGQDPLLGPLQFDPGSPTRSRSPLPGSPVIDTGFQPFPSEASVVDQRFYPRVSGAAVDMGSVEVQPVPPPLPDISVTKTANKTNAGVGEFVDFTLTATNNGPGIAGLVLLTDVLPLGARLEREPAGFNARCIGLTVITCELGPVLPGGSQSIGYAVSYDRPTTATNQVSSIVYPGDANAANNSAMTSTTVQTPSSSEQPHDLSVTASVSPTVAGPGDEVVYTVTVANAGPADARVVWVNIPIPDGAELVSVTTDMGTCTFFGNRVGCFINILPAGQDATIAVTLEVTGSGPLALTASATSNGANGDPSDPNLGNNSATVVVDNPSHVAEHDIPTLSEWMLLMLMAAFAMAGSLVIAKRAG